MSTYMRDENIKFTLFCIMAFQVSALAILYFKTDKLVALIHEELHWHKDDPLYIN